MHFTTQLAYVTESLCLLSELKSYFFLFSHLFVNVNLRLHAACIINNNVVNLFVILLSKFSQFYLQSDQSLIGNVVIIARQL